MSIKLARIGVNNVDVGHDSSSFEVDNTDPSHQLLVANVIIKRNKNSLFVDFLLELGITDLPFISQAQVADFDLGEEKYPKLLAFYVPQNVDLGSVFKEVPVENYEELGKLQNKFLLSVPTKLNEQKYDGHGFLSYCHMYIDSRCSWYLSIEDYEGVEFFIHRNGDFKENSHRISKLSEKHELADQFFREHREAGDKLAEVIYNIDPDADIEIINKDLFSAPFLTELLESMLYESFSKPAELDTQESKDSQAFLVHLAENQELVEALKDNPKISSQVAAKTIIYNLSQQASQETSDEGRFAAIKDLLPQEVLDRLDEIYDYYCDVCDILTTKTIDVSEVAGSKEASRSDGEAWADSLGERGGRSID